MSLVQNASGLWVDLPATGEGGLRLNDNFDEIGIRAPKVNFSGLGTPTVNDDSVNGYGVGSRWHYGSLAFELVQSTPGAAHWVSVSGSIDNVASTNVARDSIGQIYVSRIFSPRIESPIGSGAPLEIGACTLVGTLNCVYHTGDFLRFELPALDPFFILNNDGQAAFGCEPNIAYRVTVLGGLLADFVESQFFLGDGSILTGITSSQVSGLGTAAAKNADNTANNVPLLDGAGLLASSVIPPLLTTEVDVVASQAAMLALARQRGDIAIRTDFTPARTFILSTNSPTTLADWKEFMSPGNVLSVNGATGVIVLTYSDVSALPAASPTWTGNATGSGSGITTINASNLSSGTVADTRLSSNIPLKNTANTFAENTTFSKQQINTVQALSVPATAWNLDAGPVATITLSANGTLAAPTNIKAGSVYLLYITQDGTGSRTLAYNSIFKWAGGVAPVLSTAAGAKDLLTLSSPDGTNLYGSLLKGFA